MSLLLLGLALLPLGLLAVGWLFLRPRLGFLLLLLLLPFHTGVFQVIKVELNLPDNIALVFQSWKDGLILLLVAWLILKAAQTGKLPGPSSHLGLVLLLALFFVSGFPGLILAPNLAAGLYSWRGTFEPFIILALALFLPIDLAWGKRALPRLLAAGALVAIFAIFQSLVLGFPFLWKYYGREGILPTSFVFMGGTIQRAMGTFSSPNQLSLYLVFLILVAINLILRLPDSRRRLLLFTGLAFSALILTVSRSGWLALAAGLAFSFLVWRRKTRIALIGLGLLLLATILVFLLGLDQWIANTLLGREISANYHLEIFLDNLRVILENPLGVGLGRVGARAFRFGDVNAPGGYYQTESYLLQTTMELGLPGLLALALLILACGSILYANIYWLSDPWARALAVSGLAALIAAGVHSLLIPDLQDLTVNSYLWFLVGLSIRLPSLERQEEYATGTQTVRRYRKLEHA